MLSSIAEHRNDINDFFFERVVNDINTSISMQWNKVFIVIEALIPSESYEQKLREHKESKRQLGVSKNQKAHKREYKCLNILISKKSKLP